MNTFQLADGRQLVELSPYHFQLQTIDGAHLGYLTAEYVTHSDTLDGQRAATRETPCLTN